MFLVARNNIPEVFEKSNLSRSIENDAASSVNREATFTFIHIIKAAKAKSILTFSLFLLL
jgi:hypothetical protein